MMKMRMKTTGISQINGESTIGHGRSTPAEWEMRPGGMLVQKRTDSDQNSAPSPTIRVRVKHGSIYHEIHISSQASFGELKKMLVGPTGLHHQDQKLLFKEKERDSKAFLDICGVKDRSKIVVVEDPISQERRYLEMRRNATREKASKSISEISLEVDRLAGRVSAMESVISRGGKVPETDVLGVIELLMNQLLRLDGIVADGDVKLQRKMQVMRVQKYVETLDLLKVKNSKPAMQVQQRSQQQSQVQSNGQYKPIKTIREQELGRNSFGNSPRTSVGSSPRHSFGNSPTHHNHHRHAPARNSNSPTANVVITTNWETFDAAPAANNHNNKPVQVQPRFSWDLL